MSNLRIFESEQCDECGAYTWVKPKHGEPNYCGVCGEQLQRRLRSLRGESSD